MATSSSDSDGPLAFADSLARRLTRDRVLPSALDQYVAETEYADYILDGRLPWPEMGPHVLLSRDEVVCAVEYDESVRQWWAYEVPEPPQGLVRRRQRQTQAQDEPISDDKSSAAQQKAPDFWPSYMEDVRRTIQRTRRVAQLIRQAALWVGVLIALGVAGLVIAAFADDDVTGTRALVGAVVALTALLLLPLCAWGFGALLDVHSLRLEVSSLEAEIANK